MVSKTGLNKIIPIRGRKLEPTVTRIFLSNSIELNKIIPIRGRKLVCRVCSDSRKTRLLNKIIPIRGRKRGAVMQMQ